MTDEPEISEIEEITRVLSVLWAEVLKLPSIDIHTDFIALGGDSLNAMACIARIRARYGIDFSAAEFLLDDATVVEFASVIHQLLVLQRAKGVAGD